MLILEDYEKFVGNIGIYCYFDCIRHCLNYYLQDNHFSDKDIFQLFNGAHLIYKENEFIGYNIYEFMQIEWLKDSYSFLDNKCTLIHFKNFIAGAIEKGQPVICCVNSKCLSYNEIYTRNDNQMHFITITGLDENENLVTLFDSHLRISGNTFSKFCGQVLIDCIYNGLIYAQSFSKTCLVHMPCSDFIDAEMMRYQMKENVDKLKRYFTDFFCRIRSISVDEKFRKECRKVNYDIKVNSICYLLRYYYLLYNSNVWLNWITCWENIGNEILLIGQRGTRNKNNLETIYSKVFQLLEELI